MLSTQCKANVQKHTMHTTWAEVHSLYIAQVKMYSVFNYESSIVAITDWFLVCSYNSINMDGTLMRKAMHADPENYVTSMAPGQYWTWGTHMRGVKGKRGGRQTAFVNPHTFTFSSGENTYIYWNVSYFKGLVVEYENTQLRGKACTIYRIKYVSLR